MRNASNASSNSDSPAPCQHWLRRGLWLIVGLGALLRIAQLLELPSFPSFHQPEVDAYYYRELALRIAGGDPVMIGTPARMSPGYTYFLALIFTFFGDGPWAAPIVQMSLGMGTVVLIASTARRYVGATWALVSAGMAALYGPFVYFESHLLAASLGVFCIALLLWLASGLYFGKPASRGRLLAIGLVWGLCSVVRPNALLLFAALLLLLYEHGERRLRGLPTRILWLALGGALAIAPLTGRNLVATGEPTLITSHGGINFYIGNGPSAIGTWTTPKELPQANSPTSQFDVFHQAAERAVGHRLSGRQADGYWYRRTLDAVVADPAAWIRVIVRKLHLFWNGRELHNIYDYEFWRDIGVVLGAPLPQFLWIAPLGLLGMLWLPFRSPAERFLAAFIGCLCAGVVLVYVTDRYRVPVAAPVMVAGTIVLREIVARVRALGPAPTGARAALAWPLVTLLLASAVAVPVAVNKRYHQKYFLLGKAWFGLNRMDHAQWAFDRSVHADPRYLPAHQKLAQIYQRAGLVTRARSQWQQVARLGQARGDHAAVGRAQQQLDAMAAAEPSTAPQ